MNKLFSEDQIRQLTTGGLGGKPIEEMRFLEIGEAPYIASALPKQTVFVHANMRQLGQTPGVRGDFRMAWQLVSERLVDLVICQPPAAPPWTPRMLARSIFNRRVFSSRFAPLAPFAVQMLRFKPGVPVACIDLEDASTIERGQFPLLDRATLYFKRELPVDEFKVFNKTAEPKQISPRLRRKPRFQQRVAKLRPLPLGMQFGPLPRLSPARKTTDIFFAGAVENMPARARAKSELHQLARQGYMVDMPTERLPRDEFYKRCATAWLVVSPEGFGWDCFRHYEAAACGSVPVMNYPSTRRHAPPREGIEALYYPPEGGALTEICVRALADKPRLAVMAEAARAHFERHHTREVIARYVISETLLASRSLK